MTGGDITLRALAGYGASIEQVEALLDDVRGQFPNEQFYVFQTGGGGVGGSGERKPRTLIAFATPDAALLFAQRNGLLVDGTLPRLRPLTLPRLLLAMAREQAIQALLLVRDEGEPVAGQMPDGVTIERSSILSGE
jgi:hypothetical protein